MCAERLLLCILLLVTTFPAPARAQADWVAGFRRWLPLPPVAVGED